MMTAIRRAIIVFMVYLVCAGIVTFPLIRDVNTQIIGHPFGDSSEYLRQSWWIKHALQTGQPIFDQPLLLYPDGLNGALLWSIPLQSFPVWLLAFIMPLGAAFNVTALLFLALNGTAMAWFVRIIFTAAERREGGSFSLRSAAVNGAAFLSGLIFMTYPAFQGQLAIGHIGLLALFPAPLLLAALFRLRASAAAGVPAARPYGTILLGAILFAMCGWGGIVLFLYLVAPLIGCFMLLLIVRREGRALRDTLITLCLGAALSAVFIVPGLATPTTDAGRSVQYSAALLSVVSPSFAHPVWGALLEYPRRVLGVDPFEGAAYIGVVAGALALIGLLREQRARFWGGMAALAWLLSLGSVLKIADAPLTAQIDGYPTFVTLPGAIMERLPVLNMARTPGRFNFAVGFAVAVMAGYGTKVILTQRNVKNNSPQRNAETSPHLSLRSSASSAVKLFFLTTLILFDYQQFFPMPTIPAAIPDAIAQIADSNARAVFDVPFAHPLTDKDALYWQTAHQTPLIAGHIVRETPLDPARGWLLEGTLDPALLDAAGVDVILLHKDWDDAAGALDARLRAAFGAPVYEDARLARFDLPEYDAVPLGRLTFARIEPTRAALYIYMPEAGTAALVGTLNAAAPIDVTIALDGAPIAAARIERETALNLPLTVAAPGYHTVTIAAADCPVVASAALTCIPLTVEGLNLR